MKKAAIIVIGVSLAIALIWNLASQLSTGTLIVEVSDPAAEVTASQSLPEAKITKIGQGNQRVQLKPGLYLIEAGAQDRASRSLVEIKKGETATVKLNLSAPVDFTAIARFGARKMYADIQNLWFMNIPAQQLSRLPIEGGRAELYVPELYPIKDAFWIGSGRAVVEGDQQNFYLVSGSSITDLNLFADESSPITAVDVAPNGKMAYVAGTKLYYRDQPESASVLVTELAGTNASVAISPTGTIAVTYSIAEGSPAASGMMIDPVTKQITNLPDKNAIGGLATWSTDGAKLLYLTAEAGIIYDLASKQTRKIITSGTSNPGSFTWASGSRLLYIDQKAVWLYDYTTDATSKLSILPEDVASPKPFTLGPDGTIYLATDIKGGFGSVGTIYRFTTKP